MARKKNKLKKPNYADYMSVCSKRRGKNLEKSNQFEVGARKYALFKL